MAVYLIRSDNFIKIGYSESPLSRVSGMQTGNPYELQLIAVIPGDTGLESYLHERFADMRVRGEWFKETGLLEVFVNVCESVFPVPEPEYTPPAPPPKFESPQPQMSEQPKKARRLTHDTVDMVTGTFHHGVLSLREAGIDVWVEEYEEGTAVKFGGYHLIKGEVIPLDGDVAYRGKWERREMPGSERINHALIPIGIYTGRMGGSVKIRNVEDGFILFIQHATLSADGFILFAEMEID